VAMSSIHPNGWQIEPPTPPDLPAKNWTSMT
jgi:hypothetical protein